MRALLKRLRRIAPRRWLTWLVILIAALSGGQFLTPPAPMPTAPLSSDRLQQAFARHESGVWLETSGTVTRLLRDDLHGDRHQRFIIAAPGGISVLVSHNIDLAPKVPLRRGETVTLRGRYEWNEKGGLIHWTHHDPRGRGPGGWISAGGKRYR